MPSITGNDVQHDDRATDAASSALSGTGSPTCCWATRSTARHPRRGQRCSRPCRSTVTVGDKTYPPGFLRAGYAEPDRAGGALSCPRRSRPLHVQHRQDYPRAMSNHHRQTCCRSRRWRPASTAKMSSCSRPSARAAADHVAFAIDRPRRVPARKRRRTSCARWWPGARLRST